MNYSFEYIDIILLAMIAGFIFLRLRGILGSKSELDNEFSTEFKPDFVSKTQNKKMAEMTFDEDAKSNFLKGAKIAYENIITSFSVGNLSSVKNLLDKKIHDQFNDALKERSNRGHFAEITFIGINSANIKEHKKTDNLLKVTVDFVAEVITCIKDKDKNIISGSPDKIKKIYDTWVFSRDTRSNNPNWQLVDILT